MIASFYIAFSIHFPFCVHLLFQIAIEVFCDVKVFMKFAYILQMMLAEKHRNVKFRPFLLIWYHSFGIKANKWMSKMLILSVSVLNRIIDSLLWWVIGSWRQFYGKAINWSKINVSLFWRHETWNAQQL